MKIYNHGSLVSATTLAFKLKESIESGGSRISGATDRGGKIVSVIGGAPIPGPQGPTGPTGPAGPVSTVPGPQGATGPTGPKGDKGDKGDTGSVGPVGSTGPKGDKGDKGDTGDPGAGLKIDGSVATYGDLPSGFGPADAGRAYFVQADGKLYVWSGSAWPVDGGGSQFQGPPGPQGIQGSTGATGPTGAVGATGATGVAGTAATVNVGNVNTIAAGSNAAVTNVGTEQAAIFDFDIPRGADGSTNWADIQNKPTHIAAGDTVASARAAIGAENAGDRGIAGGYCALDQNSKVDIGNLPVGSTSTTVCVGNDSRLSDARTPTAAGQVADISLVAFGAKTKRETGTGDFPFGIKLQRNIRFTTVWFRIASADASGNLIVELQKNGSTVAGTSTTISALDQSMHGGLSSTGSWDFAEGDILTANITQVGGTPGEGLVVDLKGVTI